MDEATPPSDSWKAYRVRPRCGGGNLGESPSKETQEGPGGGPSCVFQARFKVEGLAADARLDSRGSGLTAITPAACGAIRRRTRTPPPPLFLGVVHHSAFHAAGDGHDLAGDMA